MSYLILFRSPRDVPKRRRSGVPSVVEGNVVGDLFLKSEPHRGKNETSQTRVCQARLVMSSEYLNI